MLVAYRLFGSTLSNEKLIFSSYVFLMSAIVGADGSVQAARPPFDSESNVLVELAIRFAFDFAKGL
jgi:hypothetical protein